MTNAAICELLAWMCLIVIIAFFVGFILGKAV